MRHAVLFLVMATLPSHTEAGGCQAQARVVQSTAIVSQNVVASTFAVPVAVPVVTLQQPGVLFSYGAYQSGGSSGAAAGMSCGCAAAHGEADAGVHALGGAVAPPGVTVLKGRCAKCHTGPDAKGGISMFSGDGKWAAGWQSHAQRIFEAVLDGTMPKGGKLSAEEKIAVIEYLRSLPNEPTPAKPVPPPEAPGD